MNPADEVTLAFLGFIPVGGEANASAYEDEVLPLMEEHGGELLFRARRTSTDPAEPFEIHLLRFPSEASLTAYMHDERRGAAVEKHGDVFTRALAIPVVPVEGSLT